MGTTWTKAQQKAIETRHKNLLVSAAAGSGKTAVLVERIIRMISEGENPIDIDRLLVVTFTTAAAAQMKDKIGRELDKKLNGNPGNSHLQRQVSLLQSAHISTIHSFCLNVVRNYFHYIDLDPSFKIAEEAEITLLKSDCLADVLEKWYEEGREDFHRLIESYSYSKSDTPIEDLVLSLYNYAMSNPWPEKWLKGIGEAFRINTVDDMNNSSWMKELIKYVTSIIENLAEKIERAIEICKDPDGPNAYLPALMDDRELLNGLLKLSSYEEYARALSAVSYTRLSSKKQPDASEAKKDRVKSIRNEVKKGIEDISKSFFFQPADEMLKDMQAVGKVMDVLSELTMDFMKEFGAKKEEKNILDFNDLEHFALKILVSQDESSGELVPTRAALELAEHFEEILIDEYQDSNLVQETILRAVSREHRGEANIFMVGDVKQSIYKFRLAMPELFLEKYKKYALTDLDDEGNININQRIDLDMNFRSRRVVLDFVNTVFEQIMTEPIGGIRYDDAASLKYGGVFEEPAWENQGETISEAGRVCDRIADNVELILVTDEEPSGDITDDLSADAKAAAETDADAVDIPGLDDGDDEIEYTRKELEARVVAKRIKELVSPESGLMLYDRENNMYRPAELRDIVILLRSMTGWADVFVNTLMQEGIPAYADTGEGYFQTVEIMTILNMLKIIDNPMQDIPFTGVLYSRLVGLTTDELAYIRLMERSVSMYEASLIYAREGSNGELRGKVKDFLDKLHTLREMMRYKPIHELIQDVLDMTGYAYYVMAMPSGDRRKVNIDMLISLAVSFEKGSYRSLFHFIRYVEKLRKYNVDYGEASVMGEQENTVRIMSIHKSKGLEFPIVFIGGLSKQFNMQDQRSKIIFDSSYGVGPDYIDIENRTKVPTLLKKVLQKKSWIDSLGEELRVLYVAMTRAREKLIMTGYVKSSNDLGMRKDFSFYEMMSAKSYLDLVLPAMNNAGADYMKITLLNEKDIVLEEAVRQKFLQHDLKELEEEIANAQKDEELRREIKNRLYFKYPYGNETGLRVKLSVSELKKIGQFVDDEESEILYADTGTYMPLTGHKAGAPVDLASGKLSGSLKNIQGSSDRYIPDFMKEPEAYIRGTDRGTLYHKVLELLDISQVHDYDSLLAELKEITKTGIISEDDISRLDTHKIHAFTQSGIAKRIIKAKSAGKLYKEKQFVIGLKASEVYPGQTGDDLVLVQGIIDLFFEEEGKLVIVDYKSDVADDERLLADKYRMQLVYYKKALEQITGREVKEMIIYSLYLGKEIYIT